MSRVREFFRKPPPWWVLLLLVVMAWGGLWKVVTSGPPAQWREMASPVEGYRCWWWDQVKIGRGPDNAVVCLPEEGGG